MKNFLCPPLLAVAAACAVLPAPTKAQETRANDTGRSADALNRLLATVPAGRWIDVANTHLASVVYNGPLAAQLHGNTGPTAIMDAWSGGVFDAATDSLIVWGGGHQDYYSNAVYAFNLETLTWSMLSSPSSTTGWSGTTPVLPDGTPAVVHTYDSLTMLPSGQMLAVGSEGATPNGYSYSQSWLFTPTTGTWAQAAGYSGASVDDIAKYDPADGKVYAINNGSALQSYNPTTNSWAPIGGRTIADYHMTGAIDPIDGIMVVVGSGHLQSVSLTMGIVTNVTSTGDQTAQGGNAPGFVWDASANLFVAWNGGSTIYTLDPKTWHWTAVAPSAGNTVTPRAPAKNGTFGRFQYDAAHDVFVVVNDINQDVYVFKPGFGPPRGGVDTNLHP